MPVQDLGDVGDWTAEPVNHDPFADVPDSSSVPDSSVTRNVLPVPQGLGGITGHIAATSDPEHPLTARSLPFHGSQASVSPFVPSPIARIGQGVSEAAQSYGVPTQGAERMGSTAQFAAGAVPLVSGAEAVHSAQRGDFPGTVAGLAGAVPSLGIIAGPLARTADLAALKTAQKMDAAGTPGEEVWDRTGWFLGPENKWKYEIPDDAAKYRESQGPAELGDVLQHPDLYNAYPGLMRMPVDYLTPGKEGNLRGRFSYDPGAATSPWQPPGSMLLKRGLPNASIPLHETQHAVQTLEGFAPGGSPRQADPLFTSPGNFDLWHEEYRYRLGDLLHSPPANAEAFGRYMGINDPTEAVAEFDRFQRSLAMSQKLGTTTPALEHYAKQQANYHYYRAMAGEAEARNVQTRYERPLANWWSPMKTIDTERIALPPYATGGRIAMADGGSLEPVEGDPFGRMELGPEPPDRTVQPSDIARAKGLPEPRSPMHDRIAAASQDEPRHGFAEGGGLESEEEGLQRQREIGTASGSDPTPLVRSPGLFGGARPVQPSAQFGAPAVTEPAVAPEAPAPSEAGVLRHADPAFQEGRIATRVPTAVGPRADNAHLSNDAKIGLDTIQGQPAMYAKTANIAREMPYVPGPIVDDKPTWLPTNLHNFPADWTDDQVHQGLVDHFKSNILALHDAVPDDIRPGSQLWYDGANARATQKARDYERPLENTAGVYAALSPQKDWFENVSLGDRVMDIMHNQGDTSFTPAMWKWAKTYAKGDRETLDTYRMFRSTGRKLGEINDPENQALWLRAFDEAHNPRDYNIVNPDGTFGPVATNNDGSNSRVAWGSMPMIEKAIKAFKAPDMPTISRAMGDRHKVRNFYNNIVAPNSEHGDVTIDTHAIAAANLRPMAGEDKDVDIGLGATPRNRATGAGGLYGAYAEAYRQAAAERGIQPRQMQSITWEAMRGLWNPAEKADAAVNAHVQNVWNQYQLGNIDQPTAQRMLMTHPETGASLIRPPEWWAAGWRPSGR